MKTVWYQFEESAGGTVAPVSILSITARTYRVIRDNTEYVVEIRQSGGMPFLCLTGMEPVQALSQAEAIRANTQSWFWKYALDEDRIIRQTELSVDDLEEIPAILSPPMHEEDAEEDTLERQRLWAALQSEIPGLRGDDERGYSVELHSPGANSGITVRFLLDDRRHLRFLAPISHGAIEEDSATHYLLSYNRRLVGCRAIIDERGTYTLVADTTRSSLSRGGARPLLGCFLDSLFALRHIGCLTDPAVSRLYHVIHSPSSGGTVHGTIPEIHSSAVV